MFDEVLEQLKFARGEFERRAGPGPLSAPEVHADIAELITLGGMGHQWRPAELGFDAREQFDHLERLRHVIVGTELEPYDLVDDLSLGRQHDDRCVNAALAE